MNFRLKLIICVSLLIAITFGIGGTLLISASFSSSLSDEKAAALQSFETVRNTLYLLNSLGEKTEYTHMADALDQMTDQGVAAWQALRLQTQTEVIYQSGNMNLLSVSLPQPGAGECAYTIVQGADSYGLCVCGTLSAGEETLLLTARFDVSGAYSARRTQMRMYFYIYLAVVLLGILTSSILAISLTRRLHRLTGTVRKISGGDLTVRSRLRSKDEFGQLSRDFDAMADKLQENISRLEEDMQRQEAFMGAFAHELKTPMTSIIGYADLLRQGELDEDSRTAADYIFSEGQRLEALSLKLLDLLLLKKDSLPMKEVNLRTLLGEVEGALFPALKEKGVLLTCKGQNGRVTLEPDLTKSLLYNLIDNAGKSMEHGGAIQVRGTILPGGCEIQVTDNGRGMEQRELTRITEAFYRVDKSRSRKQGGAGLGLTLCQQIVQLHKGTMTFRSAPGQGTQVTVELYGQGGISHASD